MTRTLFYLFCAGLLTLLSACDPPVDPVEPDAAAKGGDAGAETKSDMGAAKPQPADAGAQKVDAETK